jgi:hypothetical protein
MGRKQMTVVDPLADAVIGRSKDVFDARLGIGLGGHVSDEELALLEQDGDQLVEWADSMGMTPIELQLLLKRRGGGFDGALNEQIDKAKSAMRQARKRRADDLNSQSRDERKALAIGRLEMCYNGLMSLGHMMKDKSAIKMAATVAMDIARVDGALSEKTNTETVLELAATAIREQRLADKSRKFAVETELRTIDAAIVSKGQGNGTRSDDLAGAVLGQATDQR